MLIIPANIFGKGTGILLPIASHRTFIGGLFEICPFFRFFFFNVCPFVLFGAGTGALWHFFEFSSDVMVVMEVEVGVDSCDGGRTLDVADSFDEFELDFLLGDSSNFFLELSLDLSG